jgi:hypothetical protein
MGKTIFLLTDFNKDIGKLRMIPDTPILEISIDHV